MNAAVLAVSAQDTIVKLGAYAGLAAIIGLAVMALLYFAQAREVKRLREWAGRAPERGADLAQRVQADAQKRVVAQPMAPATTAAQQAEVARTAAAAALYAKLPTPLPAPPPLLGQPGQLARPVAPGAVPGTLPAGAPAYTPAMGGAPATTSPAPGSVPAATTTPAPGSVPAPPPPPPPPPPAAATAAGASAAFANGAGGQETHESAAARPEPLESYSSSDDDDGSFGFSPGRTTAIIGGAVTVVLVAIVLVVALNGGDPAPKPNELGIVTTPAATPPPASGTSTNATAAGPTAVDRRATRVAVLNGTTQTGLARTVADEVEKARFTISATETNADQTVTTTNVSYSAGNQRAAQIIAQLLGIDRNSVQPVDPNGSAAADADVVVIVGADKIG